MNTRRFVSVLALFLALLVMLTGCFSAEYGYTLKPVFGTPFSIEQPKADTPSDDTSIPSTDRYEGVGPSPSRPYYGLGLNRLLKGNILVVLLFVDDDVSTWSEPQTKAFADDQVTPALEYLEGVAKEWNVELDFDIKVLYGSIRYDGKVSGGSNANEVSKDVFDQSAKDLGYASARNMADEYLIEYMHKYDEIAYINVLNTEGRSYSRVQSSTPSVSYAEHVILFADIEENDTETRPYGTRSATVAHELLHLFGAEDYYAPDSRNKIAQNEYPKDIMLIAAQSLDEVDFGDLTAHSVGWNDTIPAVCYDEAWWGETESAA